MHSKTVGISFISASSLRTSIVSRILPRLARGHNRFIFMGAYAPPHHLTVHVAPHATRFALVLHLAVCLCADHAFIRTRAYAWLPRLPQSCTSYFAHKHAASCAVLHAVPSSALNRGCLFASRAFFRLRCRAPRLRSARRCVHWHARARHHLCARALE